MSRTKKLCVESLENRTLCAGDMLTMYAPSQGSSFPSSQPMEVAVTPHGASAPTTPAPEMTYEELAAIKKPPFQPTYASTINNPDGDNYVFDYQAWLR